MGKTLELEVIEEELIEAEQRLPGFMGRAEALREQYLSELEDHCAGSEHPDYIARTLVCSWLAELRAEYEERLARLEAELQRLRRPPPLH